MTITYYGQMKNTIQNTRVAEIGFNEDDENEIILAERIIELMEKTTDWKLAGGFDDCYLVEVDDREDYEALKDWYKKAKKTLAKSMKSGF
jgi:hypothetical protein